MARIEDELKRLIIARYGTMTNFTKKVGLSNSTVATIMSRGIDKANVISVIRICKELDISTDALLEGVIIPRSQITKKSVERLDYMVETFRAKLQSADVILDGSVLTELERGLIIKQLDSMVKTIRFMRCFDEDGEWYEEEE